MYIFTEKMLPLINQYLTEGGNPDQPGRYIRWLCAREAVYGYVFPGAWYDIGDPEQYRLVNAELKR